MAQEYYRFRLDIAITKTDWEALPQATRDAIKAKIQNLKAMGKKINEGTQFEEATITAQYHL
jgi:signal recognition particle receptor subunit beta